MGDVKPLNDSQLYRVISLNESQLLQENRLFKCPRQYFSLPTYNIATYQNINLVRLVAKKVSKTLTAIEVTMASL